MFGSSFVLRRNMVFMIHHIPTPTMKVDRCCSHEAPLPNIEQARSLDTTLERVSCEISREEFAARFEETRTPVILTGCADEWPAKRNWQSLPHLMKHLPAESKWKVTFDPLQDKWKVASWSSIREAYESGEFFYIFDQLRDPTAKQAITRDYEEPPQFRNVDLYKDFKDFPPRYGPRRWFGKCSIKIRWCAILPQTMRLM